MADGESPSPGNPPPTPHLWSRDGFLGTNAIALQAEYTPSYRSVQGPHAPHRIVLSSVPAADRDDPTALPSMIMSSRTGLALSVSQRRVAMPFTVRNAEADELHFIQSGRVRFRTDFGDIEAGPLDFVFLPRAISYRLEPQDETLLILTLYSPQPLRFDTPAPFGMINFGAAVRRPIIASERPHRPGPHRLLIKNDDGVTMFEMVNDPLQAMRQVGGTNPVWALNLRDIVPVSYGEHGGPPAQFLSTADTGVMSYTLSARPGRRPPVHHNADYDEIILYAAGPGAWGKVDQPGTLTWVPKAVTHHGPVENVPGGYQAWLIEVRPTMRITTAAQPYAELIETSEYGLQQPPAGPPPASGPAAALHRGG
jgi:homogentisate 1,2-dioxygenase